MPTYEYHCNACDRDLEIFQSMNDNRLETCPECNTTGQFNRKISAGAGILFKGSGFYETDYKRSADPKEPKSDSGSSETKAEAKPAKESTASKTESSSSSSGTTATKNNSD